MSAFRLVVLLAIVLAHPTISEAINASQEALAKLMLAIESADKGKEFRTFFNIPTLVFLGPESAGKTSLISSYVGFNVGYSAAKMANRCPVKYMLHTDMSIPVAKTRVKISQPAIQNRPASTKEVAAADLSDIIMAHMEFIGQTVQISMDEVVVEIWNDFVPNMVFIDLPGLRPDGQPEAEELKRLTQFYARNPVNELVILNKATESTYTRFETPLLTQVFEEDIASEKNNKRGMYIGPPRRDWQKHAIVVVNKLNEVGAIMGQGVTHSVVNNYFAESVRHNPIPFYVILKPNGHTPMTFDRVQQLESDHWGVWRSGLKNDGVALNHDVLDQYTGLKQATYAISQLYYHAIYDAIPRIITQVSSEIGRVDRDLHAVQESLRATNASDFHNLMSQYCREYADSQQQYLHGHDVGFASANTFPVEDFGVTFEELLKNAEANSVGEENSWSQFVPMAELTSDKHLGPLKHSKIHQLLYHKLFGAKSFERAIVVFSYMALVSGNKHASVDEIENLGSSTGDQTNAWPTARVVRSLVTRHLKQVSDGANWFRMLCLQIIRDGIPAVRAFFARRGGPLARLPALFYQQVDEMYEAIFRALLQETVIDVWQKSMSLVVDFVRFDEDVRSMMFLAMFPLDPTQMPLMNEFHKAPRENKQSVHFSGYGSYPGVDLKPYEIDPRRDQKATALRDLSAHIHKEYHQAFSVADYVEGGFQVLPPIDFNHIDTVLINSLANSQAFKLLDRALWHINLLSRTVLHELTRTLVARLEVAMKPLLNKPAEQLLLSYNVNIQPLKDKEKSLSSRLVQVKNVDAELKKAVQVFSEFVPSS